MSWDGRRGGERRGWAGWTWLERCDGGWIGVEAVAGVSEMLEWEVGVEGCEEGILNDREPSTMDIHLYGQCLCVTSCA